MMNLSHQQQHSRQPGRGQHADMPAGNKMTKIVELRQTTAPVLNVQFVVLELRPQTLIPSQDESGNKVSIPVCSALVADETGCCELQLYGQEEIEYVNVRDIYRLTQGMFNYVSGTLMLKAGRRGILERVGSFTMVFSEAIDMSKEGMFDKEGRPMMELPSLHWQPPQEKQR